MSSESAHDKPAGTVWLARRACQFLFADGDARNPAIYRILFFSVILLSSSTLIRMGWSSVPAAFWSPIVLFRIFHLPVLPDPAILILAMFWKCASFFALLGLFTRMATISSFVSGAYLIGLHQNFGKVGHANAVVVLGLAIFALARSGDALSLDSLRGCRRGDPALYAWPIRCFQIVLATVLFSAFVAKLRFSGVSGWILSDSLHNTILGHYYTHQPPTTFGLYLAGHPLLIHMGAGITLLLEGLSIMLLFLPPWPRTVLLSAILLMLSSFWLILGVAFPVYMALLLCFFFPVEQIRIWVEAQMKSGQRLHFGSTRAGRELEGFLSRVEQDGARS